MRPNYLSSVRNSSVFIAEIFKLSSRHISKNLLRARSSAYSVGVGRAKSSIHAFKQWLRLLKYGVTFPWKFWVLLPPPCNVLVGT